MEWSVDIQEEETQVSETLGAVDYKRFAGRSPVLWSVSPKILYLWAQSDKLLWQSVGEVNRCHLFRKKKEDYTAEEVILQQSREKQQVVAAERHRLEHFRQRHKAAITIQKAWKMWDSDNHHSVVVVWMVFSTTSCVIQLWWLPW